MEIKIVKKIDKNIKKNAVYIFFKCIRDLYKRSQEDRKK